MDKLQDVHLHKTTGLRLFMWRVRRTLRNVLGRDLLHVDEQQMPKRNKLRQTYLKLDSLVLERLPSVERSTPPKVALKRVRDALKRDLGYEFYEVDEKRPWGGFYRIMPEQTDKFLADFFPGLSQEEARLGQNDVQLSPKIMVFLPGRKLSWQYHYRRAERWRFLTDGLYYRSDSDELPQPIHAKKGDVVQFDNGERHRGAAPADQYVLVAEIWQHTDPTHASDESDVVRLEDDFNRK